MQALKIIKEYYPVIFYAESRHYYPYFEQLLKEILAGDELPVLYITSDRSDPLLSARKAGLDCVYIKNLIQFVFPRLKADVMIMTMTGLGNFGYKRSPFVKEYRYVFHAAVSIHQQYTENAFLNYDSFYALHRQHTSEIKALQERYRLTEKKIIPYGYPLLENIYRQFAVHTAQKSILVAPSWFHDCILETCIDQLIQELSVTSYNIIVRPHPEYMKRHNRRYKQLKSAYGKAERIFFDEAASPVKSLTEAGILITDRSGIALEYAFGTFRPVLFIDTPPKIMNPNYGRLGIEPVENRWRSRIGISISPANIPAVHAAIEQLQKQAGVYEHELRQLKRELFYTTGSS